MTQQGRKGAHDAELEYDYHRLRCLKEKLKCFVEDETKLDGDHILDNLDKEGLIWYIKKDDMFDWSFQYLTAAALDDYQRLVPQNRVCIFIFDWSFVLVWLGAVTMTRAPKLRFDDDSSYKPRTLQTKWEYQCV